MAESTGEVNRSQAIRNVLKGNPSMATPDVIATLADKGIEVKAGLVYLIRGKMKAKKRRQARKQAATTSANQDPVTVIRKVRDLATEAGGIKKLKELLEIISG